MNEYGLVLEPKYPDEAFEALSDVMGDKVFTYEEGIACIEDVLRIPRHEATPRWLNLVRNGNIRELA